MALNQRRFRGGAAAVEFAVVAIPFFMLVFGIVEYCRYLFVREMSENACREGARYAAARSSAINPSTGAVYTVANVQAQVQALMGGVQNQIQNNANIANPFTVTTNTAASDILVFRCSITTGASQSTPTTITPQDLTYTFSSNTYSTTNYTLSTWWNASFNDARFGDPICVMIRGQYNTIGGGLFFMPSVIQLKFYSVMNSEAN
jgi:Flp pilus assembly protein TadG